MPLIGFVIAPHGLQGAAFHAAGSIEAPLPADNL